MIWSKKINSSFKSGINFGLTSAVITTLGLIIGLNSSTGSKLAVIGGILTIAIADSFSDALGIHIAEESREKNKNKRIWAATISTLLSKFIFATTFLLPVVFFELKTAIIINIVWGILILSSVSIKIAKDQKVKAWRIILEHNSIAAIVMIITYWTGKMIDFFII